MPTAPAKTRKPARDAVAESRSNPYHLPRGEPLRRAVVRVFRLQRRAVLAYLRTGRKAWDAYELRTKDHVRPIGPLPAGWPDWHDFGLGAIDQAWRFTPLLRATWDSAAKAFAPQVGLDPAEWSVVNPHTERMIDEAVLAFSNSMNGTTSQSLDAALAKTRQELTEGIVNRGEALTAITKRIGAIFDGAETYRARRIAWTETSRAVHAAQEQAAIASGVVTGWRWLLSSDACPICVAIAARCPAVRLEHPFAVIGDNPHYATVKFPPAHPHCNCSLTEVLDTDEQPKWHDTLQQPEDATDAEHETVGAELAARDNATVGGLKPKPAPPPKPAPAVKPRPPRAPRPKPAPKPKPAAPASAKPAWTPGTPMGAGRPIGERIAAADHLAVKVKAIAGLSSRSEAEIAALHARRDALANEINYYFEVNPLSSQIDPVAVEKMKDFDRRNLEILNQIEAIRAAEKARTRSVLDAMLGVAAGDRASWTHADGTGFRGRSRNVATRSQACDWLESKLTAGPNAAPIEVEWQSKPKERAFASRDRKLIMVKANESPGTMVHELGHHVEFAVPGAEKAAQEFLRHRVGDQPLRPLRDVAPGLRYRADEMGRDDDFARAFGPEAAWYVGKHYDSGSTEILSMGLELLYNSPVHFAKNDPEYCKFVLGILDGSLRSP